MLQDASRVLCAAVQVEQGVRVLQKQKQVHRDSPVLNCRAAPPPPARQQQWCTRQLW